MASALHSQEDFVLHAGSASEQYDPEADEDFFARLHRRKRQQPTPANLEAKAMAIAEGQRRQHHQRRPPQQPALPATPWLEPASSSEQHAADRFSSQLECARLGPTLSAPSLPPYNHRWLSSLPESPRECARAPS